MSLVEHARSALLANAEATAHYLFTIDGLSADTKIVGHVGAELRRRAAEHIDDTNYLDLIRTGTGRYTAARMLNIDPVAVYRRLRIDMDFADKVKVAEAESLEPAVTKAREIAIKDGDLKAITYLLERKSGDEFAAPDKKIKVDHTHNHRHELIAGTVDPIDREILELVNDLTEQRETRALNAGVIDIPDEDIEEL